MSRLAMRISAKIDYCSLLKLAAESFLRASGLSKKDAESFGLTICEAYINAVKHGCRMDSSKSVKITFSQKMDYLEAVITDPGKGFDPQTVIDPTTHENRLRVEGRGIYIMKSLSDKLEFKRLKNRRGMRVRLIKKIPLAKRRGR